MNRSDFLKCIAIVTMTIDHIGAILFPYQLWFRMIGRIAFPIFAYQCAVGAEYTSSATKYLMRLFIFSLISQPIYHAAFGDGLNIGFTLFYGTGIAILCKNGHIILAAIAGGLSIFFPALDYGYYGVLIIPFFYFFLKNQMMGTMVLLLLTIIYSAAAANVYQLVSLCAIPLIGKKWSMSIHLPKYFFYAYYPIHLVVLLLILPPSSPI